MIIRASAAVNERSGTYDPRTDGYRAELKRKKNITCCAVVVVTDWICELYNDLTLGSAWVSRRTTTTRTISGSDWWPHLISRAIIPSLNGQSIYYREKSFCLLSEEQQQRWRWMATFNNEMCESIVHSFAIMCSGHPNKCIATTTLFN